MKAIRRAIALLLALAMFAGAGLAESFVELADIDVSDFEDDGFLDSDYADEDFSDFIDVSPSGSEPSGLRSARIRAVGDLMMHQKQLEIALQDDGTYDFHQQYALIADSLADADYTIANLETTVGQYKDKAYSGYPRFNAPETLLETVRDAGVDFLTLANNHMLDRYGEGMVKTVELVEQYGFAHGGANRSQAEKNTPVVVTVNGIKLGFLCYTQMTNDMEEKCTSKVVKFGINYLKKADIVKDVQKLRAAGAEVVIALPHWGSEYERHPGNTAKSTAKKLVAAGVDIVLGSHPHVVQPIQYIKAQGADGQTRVGLVAYSLGNFISNMTQKYTDSGIILDFTLREKAGGGFEVTDIGVVPLYCWNRDGMIQTLSSARYDLQAPEGMGKKAWARMKESSRELRELLDDRIPFLLQ